MKFTALLFYPPDEENKIKSLEEKLGKSVLVCFGNLAYMGELYKNKENNFYIKYQNAKGIEEKIIEINSTNVIFVKQS